MWYNSQKLSILHALFASLSYKRGVWWQLYILSGICILWQSLQSVSLSSSGIEERFFFKKQGQFVKDCYSNLNLDRSNFIHTVSCDKINYRRKKNSSEWQKSIVLSFKKEDAWILSRPLVLDGGTHHVVWRLTDYWVCHAVFCSMRCKGKSRSNHKNLAKEYLLQK